MADYFEIDFLDVETKKSGDAIPIRYCQNESTSIHVVDGGFQGTGAAVVEHIRKHYGNPKIIDRVIVTHPDQDHAGGLQTVLEEVQVRELWMLRPWLYAAEVIHRFENYSSVQNLEGKLRALYPAIAALEEIAVRRRIPVGAPFQGSQLGAFTVLAPSKARYLDLIVSSEKTPESTEEAARGTLDSGLNLLEKAAAKVVAFVKAAWGVEVFSPEDTSAENEMSVVQFANLCGERILLTGDAGRGTLTEAADFATALGIQLPGIQRFQVPHHGSRRNVSTAVLDRWLGPRRGTQPAKGQGSFTAVVSVAKEDKDHPRKAVTRALIHRGANVYTTRSGTVCSFRNAPSRGWGPVEASEYPDEQEQ
jgi:beta-lactamase superfamily II metal-dependent hydrolase